MKSKKQDVQQINGQIKEKLPEFEEKKNKKLLIPLLQTKKDL